MLSRAPRPTQQTPVRPYRASAASRSRRRGSPSCAVNLCEGASPNPSASQRLPGSTRLASHPSISGRNHSRGRPDPRSTAGSRHVRISALVRADALKLTQAKDLGHLVSVYQVFRVHPWRHVGRRGDAVALPVLLGTASRPLATQDDEKVPDHAARRPPRGRGVLPWDREHLRGGPTPLAATPARHDGVAHLDGPAPGREDPSVRHAHDVRDHCAEDESEAQEGNLEGRPWCRSAADRSGPASGLASLLPPHDPPSTRTP
jgi:hypothetical protein